MPGHNQSKEAEQESSRSDARLECDGPHGSRSIGSVETMNRSNGHRPGASWLRDKSENHGLVVTPERNVRENHRLDDPSVGNLEENHGSDAAFERDVMEVHGLGDVSVSNSADNHEVNAISLRNHTQGQNGSSQVAYSNRNGIHTVKINNRGPNVRELPKNPVYRQNFDPSREPLPQRSNMYWIMSDFQNLLLKYLLGPVGKRQKWKRPFDSVMSLLAYTVGLGNIWRFPYYCYKHGGVNYIVAYSINLIVVGFPWYFVEISLHQYLSQGPTNLYASMAPLFSGLGWGMVLTAFFVSVYYVIVIAWSLIYLYSSFSKTLPWVATVNQSSTVYAGGEPNTYTAAMNFFKFDVLGMNKDGSEPDFFQFFQLDHELVLSLGIAWLMIVIFLARGIKTSGRVVYITNTVPYVVLLLLLLWSYLAYDEDTWRGSINLFLSPKKLSVKKMLDLELWADAAYQVLFTLGHIFGGHSTLASYNNFDQNTLIISLIVVLWDTATSFLCGCVVFTSLGELSHELDAELSQIFNNGEVVGGIGVEVVFIAYPALLGNVGTPIWSLLFFVMLLALGIDSMMGFVETITTAIFDNFNPQRNFYFPVVLGVCLVLFTLGLPMCSPTGIYYVEIMHTYTCKLSILVLGLIQIYVICYVYGFDNVMKLIRTEMRISVMKCVEWYTAVCVKFLTPLALVLLLIWTGMPSNNTGSSNFVNATRTHIVEGDMIPVNHSIWGWALASTACLLVPIFSVYVLCKNRDKNWRELLKPTDDFCPADRRDEPGVPTAFVVEDPDTTSNASRSSSLHLAQ